MAVGEMDCLFPLETDAAVDVDCAAGADFGMKPNPLLEREEPIQFDQMHVDDLVEAQCIAFGCSPTQLP